MTGLILDGVLMLLLVAALGYGIRLEKKLTTLRAGQMAFAGAVTELNAAAGRAENALSSLRASGEEADILHDRLIKARAVKTELETLMAKADRILPPLHGEGRSARSDDQGGAVQNGTESRRINTSPPGLGVASPPLHMKGRENTTSPDDDRALRMAALAERIQGMAAPTARQSVRPSNSPANGHDNVAAIVHALTSSSSANQAAKHSLNRARANLDDDLFAA